MFFNQKFAMEVWNSTGEKISTWEVAKPVVHNFSALAASFFSNKPFGRTLTLAKYKLS